MDIKKICVIGLGHFGYNLSIFLSEAGAEVLAIDDNQEIIEQIRNKVTFAVCMDSTDKASLSKFALEEMDAVIVAIGEGFESSLLTTAILQEIRVKKIYNRVISPVHERLLKLMNIDDLLRPEAEAAEHLTRKLLTPELLDSFLIDSQYGIFEIEAPGFVTGKKINKLALRNRFDINLITIKRKTSDSESSADKKAYKTLGVPDPDSEIRKGDILVLFGKDKSVKDFLDR